MAYRERAYIVYYDVVAAVQIQFTVPHSTGLVVYSKVLYLGGCGESFLIMQSGDNSVPQKRVNSRHSLIRCVMLTALVVFVPHVSALSQTTPLAGDVSPVDDAFTRVELRKLLGPIALFPDELLAQLLPACAYPLDVVQASRWLEKNKSAVANGNFSGLDASKIDASVKSIARIPTVIARLNADLDQTADIGDAFVTQPDDVASVIQELRRNAQRNEALKSSPKQVVSVQKQGEIEYISIEPSEPGFIYLPEYDPIAVYGGAPVAAGLIGFTAGVAVGIASGNTWDWRRGWVYPPVWPGYPSYRPGLNSGANISVGGNINIGNDVNIGTGGNRAWRPDAGRYHPGQGSKPGIAAKYDRQNVTNVSGNQINRTNTSVDISRPTSVPSGRGPLELDGNPNRVSARDTAQPDRDRRPNVSPAVAPGGNRLAADRPTQARPSRDTAFSDAHLGGASRATADRGASSRRAAMPSPSGGQRSFTAPGSGGGRAAGGGRAGERR